MSSFLLKKDPFVFQRLPNFKNTFGNFFESVAIRRVKINTFNELHIIQEGIERHKIWKADFATSTLSGAGCL